MLQPTIERLTYLLSIIPGLLRNIATEEFNRKPAPGKWSKKEIIGHLVDSAANNHQRFVRVPTQEDPFIVYDPDDWVAYGYYQTETDNAVIQLWEHYNRHLLHIIKNIPPNMLQRNCLVNGNQLVSLQWLIEDYVVHMEHHLQQVIKY